MDPLTLEEYWPTRHSYRNSNGETTRVATNLRSYFSPITLNHSTKGLDYKQGCEWCYKHAISATDHHSCCGSQWADSEAKRRFCAQSAQFDTGAEAFQMRTRPSASEGIAVIRKSNHST
jgi:hypothetical protein